MLAACKSCSKAIHYGGRLASSILGILVNHSRKKHPKPPAHGRATMWSSRDVCRQLSPTNWNPHFTIFGLYTPAGNYCKNSSYSFVQVAIWALHGTEQLGINYCISVEPACWRSWGYDILTAGFCRFQISKYLGHDATQDWTYSHHSRAFEEYGRFRRQPGLKSKRIHWYIHFDLLWMLTLCKFNDALHLLASLTPRKRNSSSKSPFGVGPFIEEHLFGLITEFVDTVNDLHAKYPVVEKKRNIIAIGEMIKLARDHVNAAIPQVCPIIWTKKKYND